MRAPFVIAAVIAAVLAPPARASEPTAVAFVDDVYAASYSQAVALELTFVDDAGAALDGSAACGAAPCRVEVEMRIADNSAPAFDVTAPDVVVDAAGRARVRLTLVNGRHGGATFTSDVDGVAYTLTARFRGAGAPLPDADDADCVPGAGVDDGRLCPSTATATVNVFPEVPALSFAQDIVMGVGERVVLAASVADPDGDAEVAGDDVDGTGPKNLAGLPVRFAYDQNDDGSPNFITELIGEGTTNAAGVASLEFFADPSFAQAGEYAAGLHAEFPGDDQYTVARTAVRLTLGAGAPVPENTIIELDPAVIPADGFSTSEVRVRLVDSANNLLGADAPPHDVVISADQGVLVDDVERDPLDGIYKQTFKASNGVGKTTISVTVDGVDAGSATLLLEGQDQSCQCAGASPAGVVGAGLVLMLVRRRGGRRG
jgi:hypothetical protein